MKWDLPAQLGETSPQTIRLRESLTFGDRTAAKGGVAQTWQLSEETLTEILGWSVFVSRIRKDSAFFDLALKRPLQAFTQFSVIDGPLPAVTCTAGASFDCFLDDLEAIDPGEALGKLSEKPYWRLVFPELSGCIAENEDAKEAIYRLQIQVARVIADRKRVSEVAKIWNAALADLAETDSQMEPELGFWSSIFNSPTALQRWFRSYSVPDASMAMDSDSEEGVPASTQRLDKFAQLLDRRRSALATLKSQPEGLDAGYFAALSSTAANESTPDALPGLEAQQALAAVQVNLLNCDWNAAVTALEQLKEMGLSTSSGAEQCFIATVDALQVIGDFENVNMLLDCSGDRVATEGGVEGLRARVDKVSRLLQEVERVNANRFGFIRPIDLAFLTSLGIDSPALKLQQRRHRNLKVTGCAILCILFLGIAGYGLFLNRHNGKAKMRIAFEPLTNASTINVLLLPRFPAVEKVAASGHDMPAPPVDSDGVGTSQPQSSVASQVAPGNEGSQKAANAAAEVDQMRQIRRSVLADIGRQIDKIENSYDDQIAPLQKGLRASKDASAKELADKRDEIQDQFARDRQEQTGALGVTAEKSFKSFSGLLNETTRKLIEYAQAQIPLQQNAVAANALYKGYFPGWRIVATIGSQEAYSGARLFDTPPEAPANGIWTADCIALCAEYANEQLSKLDNLIIRFSANGVNIDPEYRALVKAKDVAQISTEYEEIKTSVGELSRIQQQISSLDENLRQALKDKVKAAEKAVAMKRESEDSVIRAKLQQLEEQKDKEIMPLEKTRDALTTRGVNTVEGNAAEAKVSCILFDELWKGDNVFKAVSAGKSHKVDFGMLAEGDYQVLIKARDSDKVQIYRTDWRLPSVTTALWSFLFPHTVTVFRDAEIDANALEETQ